MQESVGELSGQEPEQCSICFEPAGVSGSGAEGDLVRAPCDHHFHRSCLLNHIQNGGSSDSCPRCAESMGACSVSQRSIPEQPQESSSEAGPSRTERGPMIRRESEHCMNTGKDGTNGRDTKSESELNLEGRETVSLGGKERWTEEEEMRRILNSSWMEGDEWRRLGEDRRREREDKRREGEDSRREMEDQRREDEEGGMEEEEWRREWEDMRREEEDKLREVEDRLREVEDWQREAEERPAE